MEGRISNRGESIQRIRQNLEHVAAYVFGQKSELERHQIEAHVKRSVDSLLSLYSMDELVSEITNIMIE
jgi:Ribonuclease G/E